MKELIINGTVFANYEIDGTILFLKVIENLVPDEMENETVISNIIRMVEKKEITLLSYLNI